MKFQSIVLIPFPKERFVMPSAPYLKAWLKREQEAKRDARERMKKAREQMQQHARQIKEIRLQIAHHKARTREQQAQAVA